MKIDYIDIDNLLLDASNPRFAELYSKSTKEEDLIEYLLYTESGDEIAKAISFTNQFYIDRPLWVIQKGNKFLVRDGNRRCAAAKALRSPKEWALDLPTLDLKKLPVIIYIDKDELERRIREEHTTSLFKEWDRIAKALEVYRMHRSGNSIDSMKEIDSSPSDLIKLASFYYAAVEISGDNLKSLLRRGKKVGGGKTIIFERLFSYRHLCGYKFKAKPSYEIEIYDEELFSSYVSSLVRYLIKEHETTHYDVDREEGTFLLRLAGFGFTPSGSLQKKKRSKKSLKRARRSGPVKNMPYIERQIPPQIERLIYECYYLDEERFTNAKLALVRVTFECVLKFLLEETNYKGKNKFVDSVFFKEAFYDKKGKKRKYTDFGKLKTKFSELINDVGKRKAFESLDLERLHQIIHNYNVGGVPADARAMCDNLMPLLEFMLQEENELLKAVNLTKL